MDVSVIRSLCCRNLLPTMQRPMRQTIVKATNTAFRTIHNAVVYSSRRLGSSGSSTALAQPSVDCRHGRGVVLWTGGHPVVASVKGGAATAAPALGCLGVPPAGSFHVASQPLAAGAELGRWWECVGLCFSRIT